MEKKNSLKKITSLLLAFCLTLSLALQHLPVISQASSESPTPEELGYTTKVTLKDFTKTEGTVAEKYQKGTTNTYYVGKYNGTSLNTTYLDVDVSFANDSKEDKILYGSTNGWNGIAVSAYNGKLEVRDAGVGSTSKSYDIVALGLVNSITDEFNLKLGIKQGDTLTCAVWVEGVLLEERTLASTSATGNKMAVRTSNGYVTIKTAVDTRTPEDLGYTTKVTLEDFTKTEGTVAEKYQKGTANTYYVGNYTGTSLNATYLDADVSFANDSKEDKILYGSTNGWNGIAVSAYNGKLEVRDPGVGGTSKSYDIVSLGLVDAITDEFNLKLGIKQGDTLTCAVWVEGVLLEERTLASTTATGNKMAVRTSNGYVTIKTAVDTRTPEELGYTTKVTFEDFTKTEGTIAEKYQKGTTNTYYVGNYTGTSLNATYLDADVSFANDSKEDKILYGSTNGWNGIAVSAYNGKLEVRDPGVGGTSKSYDIVSLGLVDAITDEFNLKLGIKQGNTLTCAVWVEGVLLEERTLASTTATGNKMAVRTSNGYVTIKTAVDTRTPEELGYTTKVTFEDFTKTEGTVAEKYQKGTADTYYVGNYNGTSLNATYLDVDVSFANDSKEDKILYGSTNGWNGIAVSAYNGKLEVRDPGVGGTSKSYDIVALGLVDAITDEFNLKLGIKQGDTLTCAVWVEGVLLEERTLASTSATGNKMAVRTSNGYVTINAGTESEEPEDEIVQVSPEEMGYSRITIKDFGFQEGPYTSTDATKHNIGTYADETLDMKYLDVDVTFGLEEGQTKDTSIRYGSTGGWTGIQIARVEGGLLVRDASSGTGAVTYTLAQLGLENLDDEFNLKLAVDFGEGYTPGTSVKCDATYSLWIEDVLIAKDVTLSQVAGTGSQMALYTPKGSIKIMIPTDEEIVEKTLPTDYRKLTFASFGLANAKHEYKGNGIPNISRDAIYALDKTLFSGDVYFTKAKGADFRYGGKGNAWYGLQFYSTGDGTIRMAGATGKGIVTDTYTFRPFNAGTQLVDTWVNIKITTRIVDSDQDGKKDDVELGVWFNDKLYNNEYIYLQDYAQHLGDRMSVYVDKKGSYIELKSDTTVDTSVDFALFGYTKNWEKEKLD